jgi:hypothetical protein
MWPSETISAMTFCWRIFTTRRSCIPTTSIFSPDHPGTLTSIQFRSGRKLLRLVREDLVRGFSGRYRDICLPPGKSPVHDVVPATRSGKRLRERQCGVPDGPRQRRKPRRPSIAPSSGSITIRHLGRWAIVYGAASPRPPVLLSRRSVSASGTFGCILGVGRRGMGVAGRMRSRRSGRSASRYRWLLAPSAIRRPGGDPILFSPRDKAA